MYAIDELKKLLAHENELHARKVKRILNRHKKIIQDLSDIEDKDTLRLMLELLKQHQIAKVNALPRSKIIKQFMLVIIRERHEIAYAETHRKNNI